MREISFCLDQLADFTSQPQSSSLGQMSNQDMFGDVNLFDFDQTLNPNSMGQANPNPNSILPTSHRPGNSSNGIEQKLENINLLDWKTELICEQNPFCEIFMKTICELCLVIWLKNL